MCQHISEFYVYMLKIGFKANYKDQRNHGPRVTSSKHLDCPGWACTVQRSIHEPNAAAELEHE